MNENKKMSQRITDLETALMHLQNDFEAINEVVLSNGRRMDELHSLLERLTDRFEAHQDESDEERNLEDEKPPHY